MSLLTKRNEASLHAYNPSLQYMVHENYQQKEGVTNMFNKEENIKKLINVGFTKEQAEVLVEMLVHSGLSMGMF